MESGEEERSKRLLVSYLTFTKWLGLMPLQRGRLALSKSWQAISTLLVGTIIIFLLYFKSSSIAGERKSLTSKIRYLFSMMDEPCLLLTHCLSLFVRRRELRRVLAGLDQVPTNSRRLMKRTLLWLTVWTILSILVVSSFRPRTLHHALVVLQRELPFFACSLIHFQFLFIVEYLGHGLHPFRTSTRIKIRDSEKSVDTIQLLHLLNRIYSPQLLYLTWRNFIMFIFLCYSLTQFYTIEGAEMGRAVTLALLTVRESIFLISLSSTCAHTQQAVKTFYDRLSNAVLSDETFYKNGELSLHVRVKCTFQFTAGGFYEIGYPLALSMLGTAVTYVIMLVQFMPGPSAHHRYATYHNVTQQPTLPHFINHTLIPPPDL